MTSDPVVCLDVVGYLFIVGGLIVGWRALKDWKRYRSSHNWIPIPGVISESYINSRVSPDDGETTYIHVITYMYQLVGNSYQGSRVSFGSEEVSYGSEKKAACLVARYPAGSQQTVYYDPDDPSQSVLEQKYNTNNAIMFLILVILGAAMIYVQYNLV